MIDPDKGPSLVWGAVVVAVLISSLAARRLPVGQVVRHGLAWLAIFASLYGVLLFRSDIAAVWDRARADLAGNSGSATVRGNQTVIRMADDGHFWIEASINDRPVRFLIDSGATATTLADDTARQLGVHVDRSAMPVIVDTANGPAQAYRATIDTIRAGNIEVDDLPVLVSSTGGSTNLLGMNWLSRLRSWQAQGHEMILTP